MDEAFTIRSACTHDQVKRVAEFVQRIFGHGRDYVLGHPDVRRPESVRYMANEAGIVSAHVLEHVELSLGENWIPAVRVEYVGTAEPFRRRGLCRRLMEDSLARVRSAGVKAALIHEVAQGHGAEVVVFHCPHTGTLGKYLRDHGAAEYAPEAERETSLQMRVLDLPSWLRTVEPQLSRRIQQREFCHVDADVNLVADDVHVGLRIQNGKVSVAEATEHGQDIRISANTMAQLLAGFSTAVQGDHRLLHVLFPPGEPYWYVDDI